MLWFIILICNILSGRIKCVCANNDKINNTNITFYQKYNIGKISNINSKVINNFENLENVCKLKKEKSLKKKCLRRSLPHF